MQLAMYKGPAARRWDRFCHWWIRVWTRSPYSHAELVIDGVCYSSSPRDGGVRAKVIDLNSGRWDVFWIEGDRARALGWFEAHKGDRYDWAGIVRFVLPFLPHRSRMWFCFEAVGAMLDLPTPHNLNANKLIMAVVPAGVSH